jgi:hydrogenase nickel incorporation protein HypB
MFHISAVMLLNKVDLLPYVDFDLAKAEGHARKLNKDIEVFPVSARSGENMNVWYDWLRAKRAEKL